MRAPFPTLRASTVLCGAFLTLGLAQAHEDDERAMAGHSQQGQALDEGPRQAAVLMAGMPKIDFPVTTANPEARKFFNQGVGQLHGFWYFEAERSFRQVAKLDPACAMAWWGMAMANVGNGKRAAEFAWKAAGMAKNTPLSRREQLYVDSLSKFYPEPPAEGKTPPKAAPDDPKRHRDYVRSLEQIVEEFPTDLEAKAFLVFKIWDNDQRLKITSHMAIEALAQQILAVNPEHPVQHARIHFWNHEADRRALDAAARCGQTAPGIAHMWHMSGHTYWELKRYADAAWQQEASARVDHAYMIRTGVLPDQIHNYAHNNEWLVRDLGNLGRVHEALSLARNMVELPRHPRYNSLTRDKDDNTSDSGLGDSTTTANEKRQNSALMGRQRLIETLLKWEQWDTLRNLADTMYLDPTDYPDEQLRRLRALALADFAGDFQIQGAKRIAALEELLAQTRQKRHADADAAEAKARAEKKPDDQVAKAMNDALQSQNGLMKNIEKALVEARLQQALSQGKTEEATKLVAEAEGIPKDRLSRIWLQLGDKDKAVKLAREAAQAAQGQVAEQANLADLLNRAGKTEEAAQEFEKLRQFARQADLDMPVLHRLDPIADRLGLEPDWRLPYQPAGDTGVRPALDTLGPFRWHPSPAPAWTLPDSEGKPLSLSSYHGKPVILIFYLGAGCSHCVQQLNAFAPANDRFLRAGITLLAVSTDSAPGLQDTYKLAKEGVGFPFPIVSNEGLDVFKNYRAFDDFENTPLHGTFLVDAEGLVRWQDIGPDPFLNVDFLLSESQRLLKLPLKQ